MAGGSKIHVLLGDSFGDLSHPCDLYSHVENVETPNLNNVSNLHVRNPLPDNLGCSRSILHVLY